MRGVASHESAVVSNLYPRRAGFLHLPTPSPFLTARTPPPLSPCFAHRSSAIFKIAGFAMVALVACAAYWREERERALREKEGADIELVAMNEKRQML